jgi:hypothetical protein
MNGRKVAGIDRDPGRRGKHEPVVLPQPGKPSGLFELAIVMASKSVYNPSGKSYLSMALGGLR